MEKENSGEDIKLKHITGWLNGISKIQCAILTGSRVSNEPRIDFLSDFDIHLFVSDLEMFKKNDDWIEEFNKIMIRWPLKPGSTFDNKWITRLVLFHNELRIDFQITLPEYFDPGNYDSGFEVLIDNK